MKIVVMVFVIKVMVAEGFDWDTVRCSADADQSVPEGRQPSLGRFSWLGIIQHTFKMAEHDTFGMTAAVLIHPTYALAPAEDIAKIPLATIRNTTLFILWRHGGKIALEVVDYMLHPDFREDITYATVALVELETQGQTGFGAGPDPVLPVCMPFKGSVTVSDTMYAVHITDDGGEIHKEVHKMKYLDNQECQQFYIENKLTYEKMTPANPICAVTEQMKKPCVWDGGSVLIARLTWGHWKILGYGMRGPGCGAPTRFVSVSSVLGWIDDLISKVPVADDDDEIRLLYRRVSPVKLVMYKADSVIPTHQGQCGKRDKGHILYKETDELNVNKNLVQGFYFAMLDQVASFTCLAVVLTCQSRSNAALWVEHNCHRDVTGSERRINRLECFMYFKSTAYIEFRFYFSFRATIEISMYGQQDNKRFVPNPFASTETTDIWHPTNTLIKIDSFVPYYKYYWHM